MKAEDELFKHFIAAIGIPESQQDSAIGTHVARNSYLFRRYVLSERIREVKMQILEMFKKK